MTDIIILIVGLILFLASGYKLVLGNYYDTADLKVQSLIRTQCLCQMMNYLSN